jgi:hypothetical protein
MNNRKDIKEVVTLSCAVALEYQTPEGREYLLQNLKRGGHVDLAGCGDVGFYRMKPVDKTPRVFTRPKARAEKGEQECLHRTCSACHGTGVKRNGTACVHMISCPCRNCSPSSL